MQDLNLTMNVSIISAFIGGFLSFLSPCVLPVIPGFLSYIFGLSLSSQKNSTETNKVLIHTILFVVGLSFVFVLLGASSGFLSQLLVKYKLVFNIVAGSIVIILGLHFLRVFNIGFLERGINLDIKKQKITPLRSFLLGLSFALVWSPCIGPILGSILLMASSSYNIGNAAFLLFVYSLGMGIPFILSAVFVSYLVKFIKGYKKFEKIINAISGILLVIVGIIIILGKFEFLTKIGG